MTAFFYYGLILPISCLPMAVLYRVSDLLFVLTYYGFGYRKKVVAENILRAFPERSEEERRRISRDFYRHFCDLILESFKGFTISHREIRRRFHFENPEVLDALYQAKRSIVLVGGHYANWEWLAVGLPDQMKHRAAAIYKPLSNRFLDRKMRATRGRFGLEMIPIPEVPNFFAEEARLADSAERRPVLTIFGIDQSPGDPRKAHWLQFLGQDTGVPFGAEKYAKQYDLAVVYGVILKKARGRYSFRVETMHPDSESIRDRAHGWILEEGSRRLEAQIRKIPQYWLWTHRRWKHARPS
jgi:KDO2-lipid IV(A) lauroyltransferase